MTKQKWYNDYQQRTDDGNQMNRRCVQIGQMDVFNLNSDLYQRHGSHAFAVWNEETKHIIDYLNV